MDLAQPLQPSLALQVTAVSDACIGVRTFMLMHPDGARLPAFSPGSHIVVATPGGGLRKYSLCGDPADTARYQIAVKRETDGRGGSRSLCDDVQVNDVLHVSVPDNAFPLVSSPAGYLFIAAGIGITPIMAMLHSLAETPQVPWQLVYLARDAASAAFAAVLRESAWAAGRVTIHHDHGDPARQFDLWPLLEKPKRAHIYCCGPRGVMESVRDMTGHWPSGHVHFESFDAGGTPRADDQPFIVRVASTGATYTVAVGESILEVLRAHDLRVPSSCEAGTCGSCRTGLLAGVADHRDMVLLPDEMDSAIMVCVSRAHCEATGCSELTLDL